MPRFYVNLDHVATLRQVRRTSYPDVVVAAQEAQASGVVDGITLHLREDRRHVNDDDVRRVRHEVDLPFNFEMSIAEDVVGRCLEVTPDQATIVPERREELTTEGGLDVAGNQARLRSVIDRLQQRDIVVSLFIDPDPAAVQAARDCGASHVELHTGRYADAADDDERVLELDKLREAADKAATLDLVVNAGHGLTVENVGLVAALPDLQDLNIGHAVVCQAVILGLQEACREMWQAIEKGTAGAR